MIEFTILAIILVSLFATTLYYGVPQHPQTRSVAFALGPASTISGVDVYSLQTLINVTFQNGTELSNSPYGFNSTEITRIVILPIPSYEGGIGLDEPFLITLQYAFDWNIRSTLAGQNSTDLGTLQVANYTFSFYHANSINGQSYPRPYNFSVPRLNYTLGVNTTGYWDIGIPPPFYGPWTWILDLNRVYAATANSTNPAEIYFDLDLTVNLNYQIFTLNHDTQAGQATVAWSGRWATLQLFHNDDEFVGFSYQNLRIGLNMMVS
jgi:hypothetical protein